jgi:hypothetical protein
MGWVVDATPRPLYPREWPGTYRAGWMVSRAGLDGCGKYRAPTAIRSPDRPACSKSLYRLLRYYGCILLRSTGYLGRTGAAERRPSGCIHSDEANRANKTVKVPLSTSKHIGKSLNLRGGVVGAKSGAWKFNAVTSKYSHTVFVVILSPFFFLRINLNSRRGG